jgi:two-component system, NarL family, response regulator
MKSFSANTIRILIADDHPIIREGLSAILRSENDIELIAEAVDGAQACELYDRHLPNVLMLDLRMPEKDGLQVITELMSTRRPKPQIIVMSAYETEDDIRRAFRAGAKGYLVKGTQPEQILEAVRRVAKGEALASSKIASVFTESLARPELSYRELQVLKQLATGKNNKEIARELQITEHTVKAHVRSILSKLHAVGRAEAVSTAMRRGLIR